MLLDINTSKNCKIIIKSDLDNKEKDEISNAIDKNIEEKELKISNSNIKVHILRSSVLLNLSSLNSIKQKWTLSPVSSMLDSTKHNPQSSLYQTKPKEDKYLNSFFPNDQFAINIKSDNEGNNAVAIIERLFLNIRYRSSY